MTARELIEYQLQDSGNQLSKVFDGFPEEHLDEKLNSGYSPREAVAHLCECYVAVQSEMEGKSYTWGSYQVPDCSTQGLIAEFQRLRSVAVNLVLEKGESAYKQAHAFIVGHDYYHVGQLSAARIAADPAWDPYSIYQP